MDYLGAIFPLMSPDEQTVPNNTSLIGILPTKSPVTSLVTDSKLAWLFSHTSTTWRRQIVTLSRTQAFNDLLYLSNETEMK